MAAIASAKPTVVDTGKVKGRRIQRFETLDQAIDDVDRLVAAERAGRLKQLGNWTLGQTLGHLAVWSEFSYTGVPLNPPFFVRWILRFRRHSFLYGPMRAGVHIPGVPGGSLGIDPMPLDEALARYKTVMQRLKCEAPTVKSPIFGHMTHGESIALTLRHAELHLGFLVPE